MRPYTLKQIQTFLEVARQGSSPPEGTDGGSAS